MLLFQPCKYFQKNSSKIGRKFGEIWFEIWFETTKRGSQGFSKPIKSVKDFIPKAFPMPVAVYLWHTAAISQDWYVSVPSAQPDADAVRLIVPYYRRLPPHRRSHTVASFHAALGQMTIADWEVPMPHGDILSGHFILPGLQHNAVHHGIGLATVSPQIQSVVLFAFFVNGSVLTPNGDVTWISLSG